MTPFTRSAFFFKGLQ